jgi:hypothetical protein
MNGVLSRAIGDRIIFENGTESRIKQEPGEQYYVWNEPVTADFEETKRAVGVPSAANWVELFATFEEQSKQDVCALVAAMFVAACVAAMRAG